MSAPRDDTHHRHSTAALPASVTGTVYNVQHEGVRRSLFTKEGCRYVIR
jgi:hypothetical protein